MPKVDFIPELVSSMEPQHLTIEEEASRRLKNHPEAEG
jgi:hypothetical protein